MPKLPKTPEEQLDLWCEGKSVHRDADDGGECCPDFSCCSPDLAIPIEERKKFRAAYHAKDDATCDRMAMGFLSGVVGEVCSKEEIPDSIVFIPGPEEEKPS